jgi:DNA-binding beta-propeller fold protein YncE
MQKFRLTFAILSSILLLFACKKGPNPAVLASNFPEDIAETLVLTCASAECHTGTTAEKGLDLSSWTNLFAGSNHGSVVIPHHPEYSYLFTKANSYAELGPYSSGEVLMPKDGAPLDSQTVARLKSWITDGARDVNGTYFWEEEEQKSTGKIFNLCAGTDQVAVSDLASNRVMGYFEVGQDPSNLDAPHYIIASPDQQFLYLTMLEGGIVEKYRTDDYSLVGRVFVGSTPSLITLSQDGSRAIVSHFNSDDNSPKLTMLNTETMSIVGAQLIGSSSLLSKPHGLMVNQDFSILYVCAAAGNYYSKYEIDSNQGFVGEEKIPLDPVNSPTPIPNLDYLPYFVLLDEARNLLFISCNLTNDVKVYDTQTDQLIKAIPTGEFPRSMALDPNSNLLFVACQNEPNPAVQGDMLGCVSVIDLTNLSFVKNIYQVGHIPHGIAVSQNQGWVVVSSENPSGMVPSRYPIQGQAGPPGQYNIIKISTLEVMPGMEREIATLPNAAVITE